MNRCPVCGYDGLDEPATELNFSNRLMHVSRVCMPQDRRTGRIRLQPSSRSDTMGPTTIREMRVYFIRLTLMHRITLSAYTWRGRVTPMMQLSPSPASSQTCIPLTLAPKGRGLAGQEVGMTRQTVPDHFQVHRRNEVDPAVNRIRQSPWLSRALIAVNVPGIAIFLFFASWVWAPPGQEGLYYDAGDSIGWTLLAFPFLAICTLFNFIASRSVLIRLFYHRDWMPFLLWLVIVAAWFSAFKYDGGRHFDGSRMSAQDSANQ